MLSASRKGFATALKSSVTYTRNGERNEIAKIEPSIAPTPIKQQSFDGKVKIATFDKQGPASSLAVFIKAGSQHDSTEKPGLAHLTLKSVFRNFPDDTFQRTVLDSEMRGNIMFSKVSREHIALGTQFLRDDLVDVVPMLFKNLFNPNYQVYEFLRNLNSTLKETNSHLSDPHALVQEKLHQVAFRTGLGNPVYASKEALDQFVRKDVHDYISKFFSTGRIAVVGTGVDHKELKNLVDKSLEELNLEKEAVTAAQSKYFGGEARIEAGPNSRAIYSVGFPSVAYTKKEYAAALVLKALLGGPSRVKYGNPSGLLAKASTAKTAVSAFIHAYHDTGLLGFTVEGQDSEVKKVVRDSLDGFKYATNSISEEAFKAAKNTAIVDYDMSLSSDGILEALTREAFGAGQVLTDSDAISKVTVADVQKVAKAALAGKKSIVAYGNLLVLPYADEI